MRGMLFTSYSLTLQLSQLTKRLSMPVDQTERIGDLRARLSALRGHL